MVKINNIRLKFIKDSFYVRKNLESCYNFFSCSRWLVCLLNKKMLELARGSNFSINKHTISCKDFWNYIRL